MRPLSLLGHGIDLVELAELRRWIDDPSDPLLSRCFVPAELQAVGTGPNRLERLAGRFAAKEAVLKALGTGTGAGIAFSDVLIHRAPGSPPEVRLVHGAAKAAARRGVAEWHLTITHTATLAMASALALGTPPDA